MNHQKIKLGIIGAGKVTTEPGRHIDSIRSLQDEDVEITAIADITPGLAQKAAERFHIPCFFEDYRELLALPEINAVTINTPTATHKQIAIDCLKAGKHVYVEKPITQTHEELVELLTAAGQSDRIFIGGSNGLLQRQMGIFRQMIERGDMGEVYMVTVDRCSSRNQEYGMEAVRRKIGAGIRSHSGSHNVEWALYLLGDPRPVSVQAKGFYREHNLSMDPAARKEDDDCCIATVCFENGSLFLFKALRAAPANDMYEMKVYGDKMTLTYDVQKCYKQKSDDCIVMYRHDPMLGMQEIRPKIKCGKTHADMYRHFFACIREHKQSISNGDRGLVTMQILDAMQQSIDRGGVQIFL